MKKSTKITLSIVCLLVLFGAVGFSFFAISNSLADLDATLIQEQSADALLASASYDNDFTVSMPVNYWTQTADACSDPYTLYYSTAEQNRQFEWTSCGYHHSAIEQGIIADQLQNGQPVAKNATLVDSKLAGLSAFSRGVNGANFSRWFNTVDGASQSVANILPLSYTASTKSYSFENLDFHPVGSSLFTMSLDIPFTALNSGSERFTINADDDTWIFINNQLVLDLGGVHQPTLAALTISAEGEVLYSVGEDLSGRTPVTLTPGESATMHIFHANRDSANSVLSVKFANMDLDIVNPVLASAGLADGQTIAYDPGAADSFATPLGETTDTINQSHAILTAIVIQAVVLVIILFAAPIIIHSALTKPAVRRSSRHQDH